MGIEMNKKELEKRLAFTKKQLYQRTKKPIKKHGNETYLGIPPELHDKIADGEKITTNQTGDIVFTARHIK